MMINYHDSIVDKLLGLVDKYSANFVANTYHHLVTDYRASIYLFVTIYVGFLFINMKRGILSFQDLPFTLLKMITILTLAMNYDYFYLYIYNVFTNAPLEICKAITLDGKEASVTTIANALDNFLKEGFEAANKLFGMGGWSNMTFTVFGIGVYIATFLAGAIATSLIFLSKIASSILLALSPLFIFLALFEATKGWFDSYIQHLFSYALIPIMACAVMMITLSVTESTIEFMGSEPNPSFTLLVPFMIACAIQIWLFLQVPQKCASLASGFNLKSFTASMKETKEAVKSVANVLTGGALGRGSTVGGFTKNRMNRYKNKD
jgi:type IV secretion system protein VirB6